MTKPLCVLDNMISRLDAMGGNLPFSDTNNDEGFSSVSDYSEIDNAMIVVDNDEIILLDSQSYEQNHMPPMQLKFDTSDCEITGTPKNHQNPP